MKICKTIDLPKRKLNKSPSKTPSTIPIILLLKIDNYVICDIFYIGSYRGNNAGEKAIITMLNISDKTLFCFRKLERVKRVENRNKLKEIQKPFYHKTDRRLLSAIHF